MRLGGESPWIVASFQRRQEFGNEIMGNPYESPIAPTGKEIAASGNLAISRRPVSLWLLLLMFTLTVVMAFINLIQEESGGVISRDLV